MIRIDQMLARGYVQAGKSAVLHWMLQDSERDELSAVIFPENGWKQYVMKHNEASKWKSRRCLDLGFKESVVSIIQNPSHSSSSSIPSLAASLAASDKVTIRR